MARDRGRSDGSQPVPIDPAREDAYHRWLFVETCRDVERRSQYGVQHSVYETLLLAVLLRQLFLDDTPLINRLRRLHPVTLRFTAVPWTQAADPAPAIGGHGRPLLRVTGDCFDPETTCSSQSHGPQQTFESADQFKRAVVGANGNEPIKVQDLVRNGANVLGGAHLGRPRASADWALKWGMTASAVTSAMEAAAPITCLRAVGRATLRGLQPLLDEATTA